MKSDKLTQHYIGAVRQIEATLLSRAPRFMKPKGLTAAEALAFAALFAEAHEIAYREKLTPIAKAWRA